MPRNQTELSPELLASFFANTSVGDFGDLSKLLEQNEATLEVVESNALWMLDHKEGRDSHNQLKHKFPFYGIVGCNVNDVDFALFHMNDDVIAWNFMWLRRYERAIFDFFHQKIEKEGARHFLDVGAYTGCFSLFAGKRGLKVDAFEMVPRTTERLKVNIWLNGLRNQVNIHGFGASNSEGTVEVHLPRAEDFLGTGNSLDEKKNRKSVARTHCRVIPLDQWWKEAGEPKIDLIKMDVERHEQQAFEGAMEMIQTCRPSLIVEVAPDLSAYFSDLAEKLNYRIRPCLGINKIFEPMV